jgi:hypothetical protein
VRIFRGIVNQRPIIIAFAKSSLPLMVLKSPFSKEGLSKQFLVVPPFSKGGLGGIRMLPLTEKTFGNCYMHILVILNGAPRSEESLQLESEILRCAQNDKKVF